MKTVIAPLTTCGLLITVAMAMAQSQKSDKPAASEARKNAPSVYAELEKAPEKARNRPNPLQNDSDAVAAGAILFEQKCEECHGKAAEGSRKAPSLRAAQVQNATPGTLFWVITNGVVRKKMPVWSKLPEAQRWQLVRYIKSLGAPTPATLEPPALKP